MKKDNFISVKDLNTRLKNYITYSNFNNIKVKAEVGKINKYGNGNYYFTIKEGDYSISCFMSYLNTPKIKFEFLEGDKYIFQGNISVFDKKADLKFIVNKIEKTLEEGDFLVNLNNLKNKFKEEGLLDKKKNEIIPELPNNILLITSSNTAAYHDFMNAFKNRNPFCNVEHINSTMQGTQAASDICSSISSAIDIDKNKYDLIVITRGGGGYEDLNCFNDEFLCRYIANLDIPVISAIGHQTDITLIELVSTLRSQTPTQAAYDATSNVSDILSMWDNRLNVISDKIKLSLSNISLKVDLQEKSLEYAFRNKYKIKIDYLNKLDLELKNKINRIISDLVTRIKNEEKFIEYINPMYPLEKGYSLVTKDSKIVNKDDIKTGDIITTYFNEGSVTSEVKSIDKRKLIDGL